MAEGGDHENVLPYATPSTSTIKPITLKVFTSDPSVFFEELFETGKVTTAGQIKDVVLSRLQLPSNSDVFSLWLVSKHLQLQLKPYHCPCKLFKRWSELLTQFTTASYEDIEAGDEPVLILQRNAFLRIEEEREMLSRLRRPEIMAVDQIKMVVNLLYCEARDNVIRGRYSMTVDELHMLAGYQAAINVNLPDTATIDNLRPHLPSLYPSHMLDKGVVTRVMGLLFGSSGIGLEDSIVESYKSACRMREGCDPFYLKILYLQLCWSKPFYGSVMFVGQIEPSTRLIHRVAYQDQPITVAINPDCIHLFDAGQPRETLLYLTYDQLSWAFEPCSEEGENFYSCLWVEFDSLIRTPNGEDQRVAKRIQIYSRQAPMMDAMIEHCVEGINSREAALQQDEGDTLDSHHVWKGRDYQHRKREPQEDKLSCVVIPHDDMQRLTLESNF